MAPPHVVVRSPTLSGPPRRPILSEASSSASEPGEKQHSKGDSLEVPPARPRESRHAEEGRLSQILSHDSAVSDMGASVVTTASRAQPASFYDAVQIYQIVSNRRAVFDSLLWSVPSTSFAAQAFLFQTALAGDTAQSARIISMALSILITVLTLQLFTRQLQAEAADHKWLEEWEQRHGVDPADCAHGDTWASYRKVLPERARHFKWLANVRGFTLWSNGMMVIGMVALGVLIASAVNGTNFQNCQGGN